MFGWDFEVNAWSRFWNWNFDHRPGGGGGGDLLICCRRRWQKEACCTRDFKGQFWNMIHTCFLNFLWKALLKCPPCYTETSYNFQLLICKPEAGSHAPKFNCWSSKICISNATTLVCSGNVTGIIQYSEQIYIFRSNSSFLELLKLGQQKTQVVIEHQDDKRAG